MKGYPNLIWAFFCVECMAGGSIGPCDGGKVLAFSEQEDALEPGVFNKGGSVPSLLTVFLSSLGSI